MQVAVQAKDEDLQQRPVDSENLVALFNAKDISQTTVETASKELSVSNKVLVTLDGVFNTNTLLDYSAGHGCA